MRSIWFLSFVIVVWLPAIAQDDLHPDYRSKREIFTHIIEKDIRSDVAAFSMGGIEESVGKLPLRPLPVTATGPDFIKFEGEGIEVSIKAGVFEPLKHKLGFYDEKYLVKIDNKPFFGDYGKIPRTTIQEVRMIINRDTIYVPQAAMSDLYNPIFTYKERGIEKSYNNVYISGDGKRIYIYMLKRESGGSYEVTWVFQDKKYVKRVVDFGFLK